MNGKEHYRSHNAVPIEVDDSVLVCFPLTFCVSSYQISQIAFRAQQKHPQISQVT